MKANTKTFWMIAGACGVLMSSSGAGAQTAQLHVVEADHPQVYVERTGATANKVLFKLENSGKVRFSMRSAGIPWTFDAFGNEFTINRESNATGNEFTLDSNGNLTLTGVLVQNSSRAIKDGFEDVDHQEVLAKVVDLPVLEWRYQHDDSGQRHLGPMAEDFQKAFGLSADDKHIASSDITGVALVAIKGLHEVVQQKDDEIATLKAQNEDFAVRLAKLEEQLAPSR